MVPSTTLQSETLAAQIAELVKVPGNCENFNHQGLIDCATAHLRQHLEASRPDESFATLHCNNISFLGKGSYNHVYQLSFTDGTRWAASLSSAFEQTPLNVRARESEVATMRYVRESGLYPDIPIPAVHAWDATFDNPAGAPYILMDVVPGIVLDNSEATLESKAWFVMKFDVYPEDEQLAIVKALAKLKVCLSRPVPFDKIGSIIGPHGTAGGPVADYVVGPLLSMDTRSDYKTDDGLGGPYASAAELWHARLDHAIRRAMQLWVTTETEHIIETWNPDEPTNHMMITPQIFSETYRLLSALVPHFKIPNQCDDLVLHHPDLALRNVFFDEASIAAGTPKITGLIDWGGAQILPRMLAAQYPKDLMSKDDFPFRPVYKNQLERGRFGSPFHTVPYDWTSVAPPSVYIQGRWRGTEDLDYRPGLTAQVRRYYLRSYFATAYARYAEELFDDTSLARTNIFQDATYYLKFHEATCARLDDWFSIDYWAKETYWRLRAVQGNTQPGDSKASGSTLLVTGPNVYHRSAVERFISDLRVFPEEQMDWQRMFGPEIHGDDDDDY